MLDFDVVCYKSCGTTWSVQDKLPQAAATDKPGHPQSKGHPQEDDLDMHCIVASFGELVLPSTRLKKSFVFSSGTPPSSARSKTKWMAPQDDEETPLAKARQASGE